MEKDQKNTSKERSRSAWKTCRRLLGSFVMSALLIVMGFHVTIILMGQSVVKDNTEASQELMRLIGSYQEAETLPAHNAIKAKLERGLHQSRFINRTIANGIFISFLYHDGPVSADEELQHWSDRDDHIRESLRQIEGYNLRVFITLLAEVLFVDDYEARNARLGESGIDFRIPLVKLDHDERKALKECNEKLSENFEGNPIKVLYYRIFDIINPNILPTGCSLHKKIRPPV